MPLVTAKIETLTGLIRVPPLIRSIWPFLVKVNQAVAKLERNKKNTPECCRNVLKSSFRSRRTN